MTVMCVEVPRESVEFLPVPVTVSGGEVTNFQTAITPAGTARPTVWTNAVILGADAGVMIQNLTPGTYKVWAKITAGFEVIVVHVGNVVVT